MINTCIKSLAVNHVSNSFHFLFFFPFLKLLPAFLALEELLYLQQKKSSQRVYLWLRNVQFLLTDVFMRVHPFGLDFADKFLRLWRRIFRISHFYLVLAQSQIFWYNYCNISVMCLSGVCKKYFSISSDSLSVFLTIYYILYRRSYYGWTSRVCK